MARALPDAMMLRRFGDTAVVVARRASDFTNREAENKAHDSQDRREFIPPTQHAKLFAYAAREFKLASWPAPSCDLIVTRFSRFVT
jgi:hypothetical protein